MRPVTTRGLVAQRGGASFHVKKMISPEQILFIICPIGFMITVD